MSLYYGFNISFEMGCYAGKPASRPSTSRYERALPEIYPPFIIDWL